MSLQELTANEEIHENENGGKQSYTPARFDLLPPEVLADMAIVLGHGAEKYGIDNWKLISANDHINHALQHLYAFLVASNYEDLTHAAVRVMFAAHMSIHNVSLDSNAEAMKTIRSTMESQEQDIAYLQKTCKELVKDRTFLNDKLFRLNQFSPAIYSKIMEG